MNRRQRAKRRRQIQIRRRMLRYSLRFNFKPPPSWMRIWLPDAPPIRKVVHLVGQSDVRMFDGVRAFGFGPSSGSAEVQP